MAASAGSLLIDISTNVARLQSDMGKVSRIVGSTFSGIKNVIQGAISVGAFVALGRSALQMGDEIAKATEKLGIGAEKLSAMRYAAELSDVSFEALQKGMKFFSKAITEAQVAGSDAEIAFKAMGISVKDAAGNVKPLDTLFAETADAFSKMEDGAGKVSLAVALFGRAGMDMIPALNKGAAGLKELEGEAKRLGATISEDTAKRLETMNDTLKKIGMAAKSTAANIIVDLVGAVESLWAKIEERGPTIEKWFAKIFGGEVSTKDVYTGGEMGDAANLGAGKKTKAPNVDAIKKANAEKLKLEEEYQKRQMKMLGDRAEVLQSFYGDEAELAKIAAEEEIKGFEGRQKAEEEGTARTMKMLAERAEVLAQFYGDETELAKITSDEEIAAFEKREAIRAQIAQPYAELYKTAWLDANLAIADSMMSLYTGMQSWISTSLQGLVTGTMKVSDVLKNLGKMMLSIITDYVAKWLVSRLFMAAMGKTFQAAEIAAATITGTAVATAWAPAAAFVEIATLGGATVPAMAGLGETVGFAEALAIAGAAHGGLDYVPAESTYLLDRGERVISPKQNEDLTEFLSGASPAAPTGGDVYLDGDKVGRWFAKRQRQYGPKLSFA